MKTEKPIVVKDEIVWEVCRDINHIDKFLITSKKHNRDLYYLYEIIEGKPKRLGRAGSPKDLKEKFNVLKRMKEP